MSDLAAFLKERIDEDEAMAKAAAQWDGGEHPRWVPGYGIVVDADDHDSAIVTDTLDEVNEHIARHDPARVLREVEAKRKILAEYKAALKLIDLTEADRSALRYREWTVRALAAVYSDHEDYDPAWAASG